jgi:transposase
MNEPSGFLPIARREGIIRKEVDGELLVYDLTRDKAHCLNESAAAIWKRCDGRTSIKEIAASLAKEVGATVDERVVWLALADLRRTHLLEEPRDNNQRTRETGQPTLGADESGVEPPHSKKKQKTSPWPQVMLGMSRREAVKRIGLGAAIALPVVISITAPTPAQALSCVQSGGACGTPAQCCEGLMCNTNTNQCE